MYNFRLKNFVVEWLDKNNHSFKLRALARQKQTSYLD